MDVAALVHTAERMGVAVVWSARHLARDTRAGYDHAGRRIFVNPRLQAFEARSVLAHELSHAEHGDAPTTDPWVSDRRERRADADAARRLITPAAYAAAEQLVGPHPGALAVELDVSLWVVQAWQREADAGRAWTRPA